MNQIEVDALVKEFTQNEEDFRIALDKLCV